MKSTKRKFIDIQRVFSIAPSNKIFIIYSMITNDARCTRELKARIVMAKAAFNKKTLSAPANQT
jgi:hypothetical protein